jgi:hypothetical protein
MAESTTQWVDSKKIEQNRKTKQEKHNPKDVV